MIAAMNRIGICTLAIVLTTGLAACGSSSSTIKKNDVAKKVQAEFDKIAQARGQKNFPKITCPKDLDAKKGATTRCSATAPDGTLGITVTVNGTKDGNAQLGFKADDQLTK
jgi:hypothetical protein